MWIDIQVKAFPGRQGFCVREMLHAAGRRGSRCGNAQPSRQTSASNVRSWCQQTSRSFAEKTAYDPNSDMSRVMGSTTVLGPQANCTGP
jgi:hypothetical protein